MQTNTKEQNELLKFQASVQTKVYYAKDLRTVSLNEVFNEIKTSEGLNKLTEQLRAIQDEKEQQEFKKNNLPYFIIATFNDSHRKKEKLISSSFFVFDYDHLDEKLESMKSKLKEDSSVFAFFVSPRGNGLKVIYKLKNAIVNHDIFSSIYKHYATKFHIDLGADPDKTSDASRACFFSYDPDLYVNVDATPLETEGIITEKSIPEISVATPGNGTIIPFCEIADDETKKLLSAIELLRTSRITYAEWILCGFALINNYKIGAMPYFLMLSCNPYFKRDTYDYIKRQFNDLLKTVQANPLKQTTTIGTLFHIAKKYGFKFDAFEE
jgi:hypothetical protein